MIGNFIGNNNKYNIIGKSIVNNNKQLTIMLVKEQINGNSIGNNNW